MRRALTLVSAPCSSCWSPRPRARSHRRRSRRDRCRSSSPPARSATSRSGGSPSSRRRSRSSSIAATVRFKVNLSGSLVEQLTNLDTGVSVVRQSSGPAKVSLNDAGHVVFRYGGASVLPFFDGDVTGRGLLYFKGGGAETEIGDDGSLRPRQLPGPRRGPLRDPLGLTRSGLTPAAGRLSRRRRSGRRSRPRRVLEDQLRPAVGQDLALDDGLALEGLGRLAIRGVVPPRQSASSTGSQARLFAER